MIKRLRGRNLAHPGCLVGTTTGLILGIVLGGLLATVNVPFATDILAWLGVTVGLGTLGWVSGALLTSRFPAHEEQSTDTNPQTPAQGH